MTTTPPPPTNDATRPANAEIIVLQFCWTQPGLFERSELRARPAKFQGQLFPRLSADNQPKLFWLFVLFLFLASCGGPDQTQMRDIKKWNTYVELNNSMILHFFQPMELYFEAFGRTADYRPAAEHYDLVQFVSSLAASNDFSKNIADTQNAAKNPENDLDETAREMLPHLNELWTLLSQSRDYHAAQGYTQDNYAQAADFHARIHQAHAAFAPSYQKFSQLLHQKDAARREKDIADMLAQNMRLKSAMLRVVDAAQNMQDYLSQNPESMLQLEPDAFIALYIAYNQASAAFQILEPQAEEFENVQQQSLENFRNKVREVSETVLPIMAYCQNIQKGEATTQIKLDDIENFSYTTGQLVDLYNLTTK